jgi:hypothetical protein
VALISHAKIYQRRGIIWKRLGQRRGFPIYGTADLKANPYPTPDRGSNTKGDQGTASQLGTSFQKQ